MAREYQVCTTCVMDTSDPDISFSADGVCCYCQGYEAGAKRQLRVGEVGKKALDEMVAQLKAAGKGKAYDCVVGLSGGVDSSYLAYLAKKVWGLRVLAVHFDSGWNSELAVCNVERIVKKLYIDLYTYVVDWEEMRDLQLSFFKASVPNADIPTDHGFLAALYSVAAKHRIPYILSGSNYATESILPVAWGYTSRDLRHIEAIQKRFGSLKLKKYPKLGLLKQMYYSLVRKIKVVTPLNFIEYNKADVKQFLQTQLGWRDYGGKHYESVFTRFFQAYYLPVKFGYDKRKAHCASLIVSGQMSRDDALKELNDQSYEETYLKQDKEFIRKKLNLTEEAFEKILQEKLSSHYDYPNNEKLIQLGVKIKKAFGL